MELQVDSGDVLILSGSARENAYSEQLAKAVESTLTNLGLHVTRIDPRRLENIPMYSDARERENGLPEEARLLRALIKAHKAAVLITPEYNASVPPLFSNALDWLSRGEDAKYDSPFMDKPVALMSSSPGGGGGARALKHLCDIAKELGAVLTPTSTSIGKADKYFAPSSKEESVSLKSQIEELVRAIQPEVEDPV